MVELYQLPSQELFRALQVLHYVKKQMTISENGLFTFTNFELVCKRTPLTSGILSLVYKKLNQLIPNNKKHPYMLEWERDFNEHLLTQQRSDCSLMANQGSSSVAIMETSVKLLHRTYLVPAKLHKMYPTYDPCCFRGCNERGTMAHILYVGIVRLYLNIEKR